MLAAELKRDEHHNQGKLLNIEEETLIKMKACFQDMVRQITFLNMYL